MTEIESVYAAGAVVTGIILWMASPHVRRPRYIATAVFAVVVWPITFLLLILILLSEESKND